MTPLHVKIRKDLLNKIEMGTYIENEVIPTEVDLARFYGVSRPTVRQAIQTLVGDGYLERKKRRGTIVKKPKIKQEFTHMIESFDSEMIRKGIEPQTKVLMFTKMVANEDVATNLGLSNKEEVYKLVRLRFAEKEPIVLVTSYIPVKLFSNLESIDFTKELLYRIFEGFGHPIRSVTRKLEVIKSDKTISDLLDIEENEPIFYFHTQGFSDDNIPIEYSISKYRGDINYFVLKL